MTNEQQSWLAGLLEGEGSFFLGNLQQRGNIRVSMTSTDYDILTRVIELTAAGHIYKQKRYDRTRDAHRQAWAWQVTKEADAARIMEAVLPLMGERRSAKIRELLDHYAARPERKCEQAPDGCKYCPRCNRFPDLSQFSPRNAYCRA